MYRWITFAISICLLNPVSRCEDKADVKVDTSVDKVEESSDDTEASPEEVPEPRDQYSFEDIVVPPANAEEPRIEFSTDKAVAYLHNGAVAWSRERKCVSCHTNGTYLFVRPSLTEVHGAPPDELREFFEERLAAMQEYKPEERQLGTRPAQAIYIAAGLAQWDAHVAGTLSEKSREALRLVFELQQDSGTWNSQDCWPPFESSAFQVATMAAMAVAAAPGWLESLDDECLTQGVQRLRNYLRETPPPHDYARTLQLWAAMRLGEILEEEQQAEIVSMISDKQHQDGGWSIRTFAVPEEWGSGNRAEKLREESDFESPASDGHMTGLATLVLLESGISANDSRIVSSVAWLKSNQRESGRWWTRSLNTDDWHFITYSGTAYPLLALHLAGQQSTSVSVSNNP